MELKELIENVLHQMADIRDNNQNKRNYLVEEIEFELSLNETENGKIGAKLLGMGTNVENGVENYQRVRIKLRPRN